MKERNISEISQADEISMTENGRKIREHLERFQNELLLGFEKNNCKYSQN